MTCAWCNEPIDLSGPHWMVKALWRGELWRLHVACAEDLNKQFGILDLNRDAEYQSEGAERGTPL
jgi:hypothetical protein